MNGEDEKDCETLVKHEVDEDCKGKPAHLCAQNFQAFRCETDLTFLLSKQDCINISCGANTFRCHDGSQCISRGLKCGKEHNFCKPVKSLAASILQRSEISHQLVQRNKKST